MNEVVGDVVVVAETFASVSVAFLLLREHLGDIMCNTKHTCIAHTTLQHSSVAHSLLHSHTQMYIHTQRERDYMAYKLPYGNTSIRTYTHTQSQTVRIIRHRRFNGRHAIE